MTFVYIVLLYSFISLESNIGLLFLLLRVFDPAILFSGELPALCTDGPTVAQLSN